MTPEQKLAQDREQAEAFNAWLDEVREYEQYLDDCAEYRNPEEHRIKGWVP